MILATVACLSNDVHCVMVFPCRQHKKQLVMMDTLMQELEGMQQRYSEEKQEFLRMQMQTKVKEKIQQDLGGLTDTVVRGGGSGRPD